jgi:hypothetical protein
VSRLTPCERRVWEESCREFPDESPAIKLWGVAHVCMLECQGIPEVITEKFRELDPDGLIKQYVEHMRRASEAARRDAKRPR